MKWLKCDETHKGRWPFISKCWLKMPSSGSKSSWTLQSFKSVSKSWTKLDTFTSSASSKLESHNCIGCLVCCSAPAWWCSMAQSRAPWRLHVVRRLEPKCWRNWSVLHRALISSQLWDGDTLLNMSKNALKAEWTKIQHLTESLPRSIAIITVKKKYICTHMEFGHVVSSLCINSRRLQRGSSWLTALDGVWELSGGPWIINLSHLWISQPTFISAVFIIEFL